MDGLVHRFRQHAKLHPTSTAVQDDSTNITFQELDGWSNVLAHEIYSHSQSIKVSGNVAVCIPRSAFLLISVLAVVKAGFAYVPLDPSAPSARLDDQVSQCDAQILLVASGLTEGGRVSQVFGRALTLDVTPIFTRTCGKDHQQRSPPDVELDNTALLAILFTSGSTGRPKGVLIEHVSTVSVDLICIHVVHTTMHMLS
jgi:acyl-CoA synthetase (AMP-forming)/AMP-acid ligase II